VSTVKKRRFFRFIDWKLQREEDSPTRHQFVCLGEAEDGTPCGAVGPVSEDFEEAQRWPFEHARGEPTHRSMAHVPVIPWNLSPKEEPA
jgi:hypothetical protein